MKRLQYIFSLLILCSVSEAGLITHTDYSPGAVITSAGQNANENTIYNEFNGNIDNTNIKTSGIVDANIAATTITSDKLVSTITSTFTYVMTLGTYRRPVLQYINATTVDVENNTEVTNQTCIQFPDSQRCVTENTSATSVNRRFIDSESASNSGTKNSGLRSGYTAAANTWYALYAWKVSDNSTDFVIVGDTVLPTASNGTALDAFYGPSAWVYLGMIRNGDNAGSTTSILQFDQSGNKTLFDNSISSTNLNGGIPSRGIRVANTASASTLSYNTQLGVGTTQLPNNLVLVLFKCSVTNAGGSTHYNISRNGNGYTLLQTSVAAADSVSYEVWGVGLQGLTTAMQGTTLAGDLFIAGFIDNVLGVGYNPQI